MDRVLAKIDASGDCWEWTGAHLRSGYGNAYAGGGKAHRRTTSAHRLVYEMLVGPIAEGMQLDHLCRNRGCVNPDHLEPVTARTNNLRSPISNANRTHCPSGHAYDVPNTYISSQGKRFCRSCNRASHARRKERIGIR